MDKLISEAEQKFYHYFSPENETNLNLNQFVSQQEESFSMNSLTEMDVHLLKDKHYNEMYQDVKRYCDPKFVNDATHLDRYYVLLAGLLRTLLRATGSTFDPYERKSLIESVYLWYRDKRKVLLDYRLKSRRVLDTSSNQVKKIVYEGDALALEELDQKTKKKKILPDISSSTKQSVSFTPSTPGSNAEELKFSSINKQLPVYVNQDKKKELFISSKLKQYSRRDLTTSHKQRLKRLENIKSQTSHDNRANQGSWVADVDRPSSSNDISNSNVIPNPRLLFYKDDVDFTKMGIYQHWIEHRSREAEEEIENVEIAETISTWASNRSRIEEEIHRRQEASRYSSQTGIYVHKSTRGQDLQELKRKNRERVELLRQNASSFLDSDSEFSDDETSIVDNTKPVVENKNEDNEDSEDQVVSASEEEDVIMKESEMPLFLSPYNNLNRVTYQFRPPSPLHSNFELMNQEEKEAAGKGFVRPMTTGASNIPRTPILNYHRELEASNKEATEALKVPRRPKTVEVFGSYNASLSPSHVHYSNPDKDFFHSVLDREGLVEDLKPKAKKRPTSSKKADKKPVKGKKDTKIEPSAAPVAAEPIPPPPRPPSLLRSAQLDECDRIKVSLARSGLSIPIRTIETSILIPEDISHEECKLKLPKGNFFNFDCVMTEDEPKKKKTTKGKAKKGKKKKKKK